MTTKSMNDSCVGSRAAGSVPPRTVATAVHRRALARLRLAALLSIVSFAVLRQSAFAQDAKLAEPVPAAKSYVAPGIAGFDPAAAITPIGNFGSFSNGTEVKDRNDVGLLTFEERRELSGTGPATSWFYWVGLDNGDNLDIGSLTFPGTVTRRHQTLLGWTTARVEFDTRADGSADGPVNHSHIYLSRTFPAMLGETDANRWTWKSGSAKVRFTELSYVDAAGRWGTLSISPGVSSMTLNGTRLGAPYVVLWNHSASAQGLGVVPILIRFEKRPLSLVFDVSQAGTDARAASSSLHVSYSAGAKAGSFAAMPLLGAVRPTGAAADAWRDDAPPASARTQAAFWARATAAFPTGIAETYKVDDAAGTVAIRNAYDYKVMHDDWNTPPLTIAPAPPLTALAQAAGYPVVWNEKGARLERSPLATFLGPYAFERGSVLSYTLPLLTARDQMLAPVAITNGDAFQTSTLAGLNDYILSRPPTAPLDGNGGMGLPIKEFAEAYPILSEAARQEITPVLTQSVASTFGPENLQTVTEPTTGQRYVMSSKIWCAKEAYDREWYTGRQLDALGEYAQWVDRSVLWPLYPAVQGLYAYYRLYADWAWSGTASSVYGFNLTGDGMNFSMEGMLATARIAHRLGDDATRDDALYRAAKQAIPAFAEFAMPRWLQSINDCVWTDTSYDPVTKHGQYKTRQQNPADVITGFGIDIYAEDVGARTLRPGMFWHATTAIFWNNPSLYRLYLESGLYDTIYRWDYITMPKLHPSWYDHGVIQVFENAPYGGGNSAAHLVARSILFGEPGAQLKAYLDKMGDMEHFQYVNAVQSTLRSDIPQAWIPGSRAHFVSNVWDAKAQTLTTKLVADETGAGGYDFAWRDWTDPKTVISSAPVLPSPGVIPEFVRANGKPLKVTRLPSGFWHVDLPLTKSAAVTVVVQYRKFRIE